MKKKLEEMTVPNLPDEVLIEAKTLPESIQNDIGSVLLSVIHKEDDECASGNGIGWFHRRNPNTVPVSGCHCR
uniref:Uncharacterized protein n=1 Tax=Candidatus Kentrum eta TaxID=2126337 RepID=A0A450UMF1_9GAMM|nr:MAG: hypothetical protein BECKH772A_GA0070896_1005916 [Candidatus Kentron sp. H]VFJ94425.1 MAG: hypothetical protein BECKH772B_GA0070898_1006116 [Candidatus Kentron sp. H]VFK01072.1 MAG: hypothetical protein BECKH772C_GA0070978_1005714 [Candidatus Kentron sp. H]